MIKQVFDAVFKYYSSELIYFEQHMPKADSLNQVYYPYCKYTLDLTGLVDWYHQQGDKPWLAAEVTKCLFNKDKQAFTDAVAN